MVMKKKLYILPAIEVQKMELIGTFLMGSGTPVPPHPGPAPAFRGNMSPIP